MSKRFDNSEKEEISFNSTKPSAEPGWGSAGGKPSTVTSWGWGEEERTKKTVEENQKLMIIND